MKRHQALSTFSGFCLQLHKARKVIYSLSIFYNI